MTAELIALSSQTAITFKRNNTELANWTKRGYFLEGIIILSVPICVWGFLGNTIVLWLLCYRIKRTRFSVYILSLVIADLTVVLYYISAFILFLTPIFINLHILRLTESIYLLGYYSSIYFLTALVVERYLTVFFPVWWLRHRPKGLSKMVSAGLWTLSCLISLTIYIACFPRFLSPSSAEITPCNYATLFEIIINCFIIFPIMFFCTLSLFIRMQRKARKIPQAKLDITICLIVLLSLIFAFSVEIVDIVAFWIKTLDAPVPFLLSLLFDSIKSSINPLIFFLVGFWKRKKIPEPMYKFLERALKDKEDGVLRTHAKPRTNLRVSWASELDRKGL